MKILIIEDEQEIAQAIKKKLKEKFTVDIANDGLDGYILARTNIYDLIILDLMLPSLNGYEILNKLRKNKINSRIIVLSAKAMLEDKLKCLNNGANDYITKPFHIEELIARINIQLNDPTLCTNNNTLKYKDLTLDLRESKLYCNDKMIELLCKEFLLMEYFISNNNIILTKQQLYNKVWGFDNESHSNNVEVYLTFLRRKLKAIGSNVNIKSVRGLGYKMEYKNE